MKIRLPLMIATILMLSPSSHLLLSQTHHSDTAKPSVAATGTSPTYTMLAKPTDPPGNFSLTLTCTVIGARIPGVTGPTGQVTIEDNSAKQALATGGLFGGFDATYFAMLPTTADSSPTDTLQAIVTGDFNGDGKLDLAVVDSPANGNADLVMILLGRGDGTFQIPTPVAVSLHGMVSGLVGVDLNGDGKLDLVVGSYEANNVSILLGNGDGTFQAEKVDSFTAPTGATFAQGLVAGDFNGDGKKDLAFAVSMSTPGGSIATLFGNGDGTFQAPVTYAAGMNYSSTLLAGNFNNDGKDDLLELYTYGTSSSLFLLLSNGDGTFQTSSLGPYSHAAVRDFNGDGLDDIAALGPNDLTVFLNSGNGQFTMTSLPPPASPYEYSYWDFVEAGDFNGDGNIDLVVSLGNYSGELFLGNGSGTFQTFTPNLTFPTSSDYASQAIAGDFQNNGYDDIATLSENSAGLVSKALLLLNGRYGLGGVGNIVVTPGTLTTHNITCDYAGDAYYAAGISVNAYQVTFQQAPAPSFSLPVGQYATAQTVAITTPVVQGTINYTTDGTTPTLNSPIYTAPITIAQTQTLKAIASASYYAVSPVAEAVYTIAPIPAAFKVAPASLTFPSTYLNVASAPQTLTITNTGSITANVKAYAFSGSGASQFSISGKTCGTSLVGGASCTLTIGYKPTVDGAVSASLVATDSATGSPQSIPLSGTGSSQPSIVFSPAYLSFPDTPVGSTSAYVAVTVKNPSPFPASVSSYTFDSTNGFSILGKNCVTSLAADSACTILIVFKPTIVGFTTASLIATDSATGSPQNVGMSGFATTQPTLVFSPASLSFPTTSVGATSSPQVLTVSNTSNGALMTVSSYTFSGANASEFSLLSKTCTGSLGGNSSCTLTIVFKPTLSGSATASLLATDNAAGSPQAAPLTGTAP